MVKNQEQKRIYLACPYSDSSPIIRQERYNLATQMAAALMKQGHSVFSPITQGHHICEYGIEHGFDAWKNTDLSIIELWATDVFILKAEGFENSKGVLAEYEYADNLGIPVTYIATRQDKPSQLGHTLIFGPLTDEQRLSLKASKKIIDEALGIYTTESKLDEANIPSPRKKTLLQKLKRSIMAFLKEACIPDSIPFLISLTTFFIIVLLIIRLLQG